MALKNKKAKIETPPLSLEDTYDNASGEHLMNIEKNQRKVEWESKDISLRDIRVNPDNKIFTEDDTEEEVEKLAQDIKRNGLLHNLVVFPQVEDKKTVYVLLSGERRYKALDYLQKKGDAKWNTARACRVITTPLSENEKKVLLYSANLQVRGGIANEKIRRNAITEYIACLQKEPYNLTEAQAKKALKEVAAQSTSPKQLERDYRIEKKLNPVLKNLLNEGFLMRVECECYIKLDDDKQQVVADNMSALKEVDCNGDGFLMESRNEIHKEYSDGIAEALKADSEDELNCSFEDANKAFDEALQRLQRDVAAHEEAVATGNTEKAEEIKETIVEEQQEKNVARRERRQQSSGVTFAEKTLQPITVKIDRKLGSKEYRRKVAKWTPDMRVKEIEYLDALIEKAQSMKEMIETAE